MSKAEAIYNRAPVWLQNLLVSLRGWDYRYRRANDQMIYSHLELLLQSQHWTQEQFAAYQIQALQRILKDAFANVPYYRRMQAQLGCHVEDFRCLEDIQQLPILEKHDLRGHEKEFLNESNDLRQCSHGFTSGTTGTPLNLYESQESFSQRWAFVARLRTWAGITNSVHSRRVQFTGRNIISNVSTSKTHVYWRYNYFGNALLCSTTHLTPETVPYYVQKIRAFSPELMEGYPSAMLIVARVAQRLGLSLPHPKAIITSAETLFPEDRQELQRAFNCKVYDQYAASEPSCFWCDCEHGMMHVNPEYGISEIVDVDGNPVLPGEAGEVLVTSFLNPVMPLIRYRLGDMAIADSDTSCSCGRQMPCIKQILGRIDDILFIPQRGYVGRMDPAFKGLSDIIETQIIQESLDKICVKLVPGKDFNEALAQKLTNNLRMKLGNEVCINIELVTSISRGPNGKFRSVISKVKHLYPDPM